MWFDFYASNDITMKCIFKEFQILRIKGPLQPAFVQSHSVKFGVFCIPRRAEPCCNIFFHAGRLTVLHRPSLQDMAVLALGKVNFNQHV